MTDIYADARQIARATARRYHWRDVDDLEGQASLYALLAERSWNGLGRLEGWVAWIVSRRLKGYIHAQAGGWRKNDQRFYPPRDTSVAVVPEQADPHSVEDAVVERAWFDYVMARVALLPEREREALLTAAGDSKTLAEQWGVDRSRVSQLRTAGRRHLALLLDEDAA